MNILNPPRKPRMGWVPLVPPKQSTLNAWTKVCGGNQNSSIWFPGVSCVAALSFVPLGATWAAWRYFMLLHRLYEATELPNIQTLPDDFSPHLIESLKDSKDGPLSSLREAWQVKATERNILSLNWLSWFADVCSSCS